MSEEKILEQVNEWQIGEEIDRHTDPLLDCLLQISKIHGRPATRTGLSSGLPLVSNRLTVETFARAAARADLSSHIVGKPLEEISKLQLPAILLLNERQACVLIDVIDEGNKFKVLLPETGMGEKIIPREDLEKIYTGYTIFVNPKYRVERKSLDDIGAGSTTH